MNTSNSTTPSWAERFAAFKVRFLRAVDTHPAPAYAYIESAFWLLILVSILDHVRSSNSTTSGIIWYLTIGPHEIGHFVCMPFGQVPYIAGGSFWQIMFWGLLGVLVLFSRRQITGALVLWAIAGHSFINLARYIGDARARQLPLLFGMGTESHDWYNLLSRFNLLNADTFLAALSTLTGIIAVIAVCVAGITLAWMVPRTGFGPRWKRR